MVSSITRVSGICDLVTDSELCVVPVVVAAGGDTTPLPAKYTAAAATTMIAIITAALAVEIAFLDGNIEASDQRIRIKHYSIYSTYAVQIVHETTILAYVD
jgi:hypothetical protein